MLGPPLENVLRCLRPFILDQKKSLALVEQAAEMPAEVIQGKSAGEQAIGTGAVEAGVVPGELFRQPGVARGRERPSVAVGFGGAVAGVSG